MRESSLVLQGVGRRFEPVSTHHRIILSRLLALALIGAMLAVGSTAFAQSSQDLTCQRAAQDYLETCQKRIKPVERPADPNNLTASEQKALDKHTKAWQGCTDTALKRASACAR